MKRLEREFSPRGVSFWFVYPNATETSLTISAHLVAYGVRAEQKLTDPDGRLRKLTAADTTPEAAIVVREGTGVRTVYVGRVDDKNLSLGTERPTATRHDLEEALAAVLAGRSVPKPGGPPVGCYFVTRR
jgi:hypothetical protein